MEVWLQSFDNKKWPVIAAGNGPEHEIRLWLNSHGKVTNIKPHESKAQNLKINVLRFGVITLMGNSRCMIFCNWCGVKELQNVKLIALCD